MESILTSIKKTLGIPENYEHFDYDIIMHINSIFSILTQLGVGPVNGFLIEDKFSNWTDFIGGSIDIEIIKSYVSLRVRLLFDPPSSSAAIESANRMIKEFEWRINELIDAKSEEVSQNALL